MGNSIEEKYIRTESGYILTNTPEAHMHIIEHYKEYVEQLGNIKIRSNKIIDVIVPGDYINGEKVLYIFENKCNHNKLLVVGYLNEKINTIQEYLELKEETSKLLSNKDIKQGDKIVTKECFMAVEYEV